MPTSKYNNTWMKWYYDIIGVAIAEDKEFKKFRAVLFKELDINIKMHLEEAVKEASLGGQVGQLDYNVLFIKIRKHLRKVRSKVDVTYGKITHEGKRVIKRSYDAHRNEMDSTLKSMGARKAIVKEEAPNISVSFNGTRNANFKKHLKRLLQQGHYPDIMIKTLSAEHIAMLERKVMISLSQGKGFNWARDELLKDILPDGINDPFAKSMGYKIDRITRTAYREAVNMDMTEFVLDNPETFYGSRRVADGRPCTACIVQDGDFYPPGAMLGDHPNGMCILVPLVYPEEYLLTGRMTDYTHDDFGPTLLEKFYSLDDKEQMRILGKSMFALWVAEKFDLKSIVSSQDIPLPHYKVLEDLEKFGGISAPQSRFATTEDIQKLNPIIDPADRKTKKVVTILYTSNFVDGKSSSGLKLDGDGSDLVSSRMSEDKKAQLLSKYPVQKGFDMYWLEFNSFAREAGIYTRKAIDGTKYLVIPVAVYDNKSRTSSVKPERKI